MESDAAVLPSTRRGRRQWRTSPPWWSAPTARPSTAGRAPPTSTCRATSSAAPRPRPTWTSGRRWPRRPSASPPDKQLAAAAALIRAAKKPLVIVGKGAAIARAENEVRAFIAATNLPFLPTPMGKGLVPDQHACSVSAARTLALQEADVVLLVGAKLNWILHFGRPPRFRPDVKVVQVDICPEEFSNSRAAAAALMGDVGATVAALDAHLSGFRLGAEHPWWRQLKEKRDRNQQNSLELSRDVSVPLNYYAVFAAVQALLPKNATIVTEGANTMDIGRSYLLNSLPRHRLDAGSFGTMGVGLGSVAVHKRVT